jgi:hypothetical protein
VSSKRSPASSAIVDGTIMFVVLVLWNLIDPSSTSLLDILGICVVTTVLFYLRFKQEHKKA